jgi:protein-S-isoprenylcysteine O-methyltransferase Ste14
MNKYIFSIIYLGFFLISLLYQLKAEKKVDSMQRAAGKKYKEWTHTLITFTYVSLSFGALIEYFILYGRKINLIISFIGFSLFILGIIGRNISIKTLGEFWSGDIEIKKNHAVVKTGIYALLRHPNYSSMILKAVGFALVPNAYYTLTFALVVYVPIILVRLHHEENILMKELGKEYTEYKRKVWALLPFKREIISLFRLTGI